MTLVSMSPQYLLTVTVSQTIFVLDDLDRFWGRLDRYFSDAPLVQFVLSFFKKIMVCLWLWGFWVKTTELKCPSRYMVRRTCSVHIDLDRGATAIYCLSVSSAVKFLSPLCFPNCVLWNDVTSNTEWGVRLPLLRLKNLHNLFGILLYLRFASSHGEILKLWVCDHFFFSLLDLI